MFKHQTDLLEVLEEFLHPECVYVLATHIKANLRLPRHVVMRHLDVQVFIANDHKLTRTVSAYNNAIKG